VSRVLERRPTRATAAPLPTRPSTIQSPHGIEVDAGGNVYVPGRDRIRRIDAATGRIDTVVAGIEAFKLNVRPDGTIYFLSGDPSGGRVHRFSGGGVETVVGNGTLTPRGDGGQATAAGLLPTDVALAPDGALLVLQTEPFAAVRRVDPRTGVISTFVS
jgi:streptogramin lyase